VKRAVLALVVMVLVASVVVGAGSYWTLRSTVRAFEPPAWSDDAALRDETGRVFGVKFVERPTVWRARQQSAQDVAFVALARLGDAAATQRFLDKNQLEPQAEAGDDAVDLDATEEELGRLAGPVRARRVLKGKALESPQFTRSVVLLDVGEVSWVALEAHER
jgi:hypothetical protein